MKKHYLISMFSAMLMILLCFGLYQDQSFNTLNTADAQTGEAIVSNIEAVIVTNPNPIVVTDPDPVSAESSAACANSTQQIAVIWENDIDQIENVTLVYRDAQNNVQEIDETERTEKAILFKLFKKDFSDSIEGNYQLIGLKYRIKGSDEDQTFAFDDKKIDAEFTVTCLDAATAASQVQIEIQDLKTCETVVANGITDALRAMADSAEENDPDTTGSKVVVLNPCHGGSDLGACANGLQEKDLNLKIAQYCKAELETYEGVTVYMTRTDDTERSSDDIIQFAVDKDADLLISIHNNAGSGKTAKVYYPENKNDALDLSVQEENVSDNIWSQLDDLEINQRGSKILDNEKGVRDYAVNKRAEESGFCAFIIDHTLLDEAGDADNFSDSDENLQKLGIADAAGIANYYGLSKKQADPEPSQAALSACGPLNTGMVMNVSNGLSDSSESESPIADGVYVFHSALDSDKVMSVSTAAIDNGANIQLGRSNDTQSQYFRVTSLGDGYYSIVNVFSGKSLDVCWGSSSSGANLWQYGANVTRAQKWRFYSTGDGNYTIVSALGTVIDVAGAGTSEGNNIWMYASNGTDAQKWTLTAVEASQYTEQPIEDGVYVFHSALDNNKAMDVSGASTASYANIQLWDSNNTEAQFFKVKYLEDGYYSITNVKSNKSLDVCVGSNAPGANLWQFTANGTNAQKWRFYSTGDGNYTIVSALGTVIDVAGGGTSCGNNIWMYASNGTNAQKWKLTDVTFQTEIASLTKCLDSYYTAESVAAFREKINQAKEKVDAGNLSKAEIQALIDELKTAAAQLPYKIGTSAPVVYITTDDGTGNQIEKADGYIGTTIAVVDTDGSTIKDTSGKIKVRGNSTAAGEKKPFTIKFDEKQNVLQMGKSKKWALLANLYDPTGVRNAVAFDLAKTMGLEYTSEYKFVELYVDGVYKGVYTLTEPVEAGKTRVDIDVNNGDFLIEREAERTEEDVTYITLNCGLRFAINEPEDLTDNQVNQIKNQLNAIVSTMQNGTYEDVKSVVDIDSFAKFYVLNELLKPVDFNYSSTRFYFQYDDNGIGKLYAGPVWDYDLSSGNCSSIHYPAQTASTEGNYVNSRNIYAYLCKHQEFLVDASKTYKDYQNVISNISADGGLIDSMISTYADIIEKNNAVWNPARQYSDLTKVPFSTYDANVQFLKDWLRERNEWMSNYFLLNTPAVSNPIADGIYVFHSALDNSKVLDVSNASTESGANIQLWESNNTQAQFFKVNYLGDGYYSITNVQSRKSLDVCNGSSASGANLWQYTVNGTQAQKWRIVDMGDSTYTIVSALGTVIDVAGGGTSSGNNVWMYTYNGTNAQKWKLTAVAYSNADQFSYLGYVSTSDGTSGWQDAATLGKTAETTADSSSLEALQISFPGYSDSAVRYRTYVQDSGWQDYAYDGAVSGTIGKSLQAIQIDLVNLAGSLYDVYYRCYVETDSDDTWLDWACNGESAGTLGTSKKMKAIQIVLVEKGGDAPGSTAKPCYDVSAGGRLVSVALNEVGYAQDTTTGYTKYGAWYSGQVGNSVFTNSAWCAMFVSWCANQAGISGNDVPCFAWVPTGFYFYKNTGRWHTSNYVPKTGDIIFFEWDANMSARGDHVGIVQKVSNGRVYTIEGNSGNSDYGNNGVVRQKNYSLLYNCILGYGSYQ